jgi:membrane fusion protein
MPSYARGTLAYERAARVSELNAAPKGLFTHESLEAAAYRRSGEPAAIYPVTLGRLAVAVATMMTLVGLAIFFVPYTKYYEAPGEVEPSLGLHVETSGQRGTIRFAEGLKVGVGVAAGATIGTLRVAQSAIAANSLSDDSLQLLERKLSSMEESRKLDEESVDAQARAAFAALQHVTAEGIALQTHLDSVRDQIGLKNKEIDRAKELAAQGYVSSQYLTGLEGDIASLRSGEAEVVQRLAAYRQQEIAARETWSESESQKKLRRAKNEQELNELRSRITAAKSSNLLTVRAAKGGRIVAVHATNEQSVAEDSPIVSILPEGTLEQVACLADARLAAYLLPGALVRVTFDDYPYLIYGGETASVIAVEEAPSMRREHSGRTSTFARYRVSLALQGHRSSEIRLVAGMPVSVAFPIATHKLSDWIFLSSPLSRHTSNG